MSVTTGIRLIQAMVMKIEDSTECAQINADQKQKYLFKPSIQHNYFKGMYNNFPGGKF